MAVPKQAAKAFSNPLASASMENSLALTTRLANIGTAQLAARQLNQHLGKRATIRRDRLVPTIQRIAVEPRLNLVCTTVSTNNGIL